MAEFVGYVMTFLAGAFASMLYHMSTNRNAWATDMNNRLVNLADKIWLLEEAAARTKEGES